MLQPAVPVPNQTSEVQGVQDQPPAAVLPTQGTRHEVPVLASLQGAVVSVCGKRKAERTSQDGGWHQEHPRRCLTGSAITIKHLDSVKTSCSGGKETVSLPFGWRRAVKPTCHQLDTASQLTGFCKRF